MKSLRLFLLLFLLFGCRIISSAQQWLAESNPNESHRMNLVAVDSQGAVYVGGEGPGDFFNGSRGKVVKYNAEGSLLWEVHAPFVFDTSVWHYSQIIVDSQDNLIVAGYVLREGTCFSLLQKYSPQGTLVWAREYSGLNNSEGVGEGPVRLRLDARNNIYLAGTLYNAPGVPASSAFILKYNSQGDLLWDVVYTPTDGAPTWGQVSL